MFGYRDVDEGQQIEERLMIPVGAGIVVQDGWKMADFVSDLRGEIGEQAKQGRCHLSPGGGFMLTPNFWFYPGRALGCAGSLPMILKCGGAYLSSPIYESLRCSVLERGVQRHDR